jgi:hypothetical protein
MIRCAVLDDYQDVALGMADWPALAGRVEARPWRTSRRSSTGRRSERCDSTVERTLETYPGVEPGTNGFADRPTTVVT